MTDLIGSVDGVMGGPGLYVLVSSAHIIVADSPKSSTGHVMNTDQVRDLGWLLVKAIEAVEGEPFGAPDEPASDEQDEPVNADAAVPADPVTLDDFDSPRRSAPTHTQPPRARA